MLIKQNSPSLPRNLSLGTFGELLIANSQQSKSDIPALLNSLDVLSSASDKAKLLAKNFHKNSNIADLGITLPVFPSGTTLTGNCIIFP